MCVAAVFVLLAFAVVQAVDETPSSSAWRLVNSEAVEVWRLRSVQFFEDLLCQQELSTVPNQSGTAFATAASEMTGVDHVFAARSMRGWESEEHCPVDACHVGFEWNALNKPVRCLLLSQGETGLHAAAITLQRKSGSVWENVATWTGLQGGRSKVAVTCPEVPVVPRATVDVDGCLHQSGRSIDCRITCDDGFGAVQPSLHCMNGAWFSPECLPVGSMLRVLAMGPALIKPYWVVLDAHFFEDEDCSKELEMQGVAISSGEYVIKYANYHAKNIFDGSEQTSWAASEPCTPGSCWFGFKFRSAAPRVRCVQIIHPHGAQYHADSVSLEVLGSEGWTEVKDIIVRFLPEPHSEL